MRRFLSRWALLAASATIYANAGTSDFAALCADRTAIERVYYTHRLGEKPPFDKVLPRTLVERMVRDDLRKRAALKRVYGVEIGPAEIAAEVRRIETTTRSPDVLAELKAAVNNDTNRFARMVAEPIWIDRELRKRFADDAKLHGDRRREVEKVREKLLAAKQNGQPAAGLFALLRQDESNHVAEITWNFGTPPSAKTNENAEDSEIKKRFGPNARLISGAHGDTGPRKLYFEEVPAALRRVLAAQLLAAGDVSAVIELPSGFALYLAEEKTAEALKAANLSIPKRSYQEWLASLDLPEAP